MHRNFLIMHYTHYLCLHAPIQVITKYLDKQYFLTIDNLYSIIRSFHLWLKTFWFLSFLFFLSFFYFIWTTFLLLDLCNWPMKVMASNYMYLFPKNSRTYSHCPLCRKCFYYYSSETIIGIETELLTMF